MWVALRFAATLPVTVASAERSFRKLKLSKTYRRSTISQERLNGFVLMSISKRFHARCYFGVLANTHKNKPIEASPKYFAH